VSLQNDLTEMLNLRYPIVSAPMAGVSGGELAAAVTNAGGLGLIGAGYNDANWLTQQIALCHSTRFGVGLITWKLAETPDLLTMALTYQPVAIMLSFGDPKPYIDTIKKSGAKLICQVQTVADAIYVKQLGADIIVAQGSEAGGHGASRGTFALVPAVVDSVMPIPVLAAGGVADARGFAAALALGAHGVLVGTRFYACKEALGHAQAKEYLTKSTGDETIRSTIFDSLRQLNWPRPYTARTLQNILTANWNKDPEILNQYLADPKIYQTAVEEGNYAVAAIFAGEDVDLIHEILSAKQIIDEMVKI
jgi:nitronate monooxygenase